MRARYLRAVLRQDVEYFDLRAGSASEVVAGVSNDSLVVQDALGDKLPSFLMNVATFAGSYAVGFALLWRLTLVTLPSVLLLVIPGFAYSRIVTGLARRIRAQYAGPGAIAEQAVSSACTTYTFVAEASTMARFAAALEESARLGVKQGLAKGVALGSNGVAFAIYAFNVWYGSRLVMYHGVQGGTVFIVASLVIIGGVSLGSALSNVVERQVLLGGDGGGGEGSRDDTAGVQHRLGQQRRRRTRQRVRNRMPVSLRGGGGELGNLKP
jgi:ATP-binding cassette subfamily B (MDR/TAP) protein 1